MGFGDLKSRAGQQNLNSFLETRSYIEGKTKCKVKKLNWIFNFLTFKKPLNVVFFS